MLNFYKMFETVIGENFRQLVKWFSEQTLLSAQMTRDEMLKNFSYGKTIPKTETMIYIGLGIVVLICIIILYRAITHKL